MLIHLMILSHTLTFLGDQDSALVNAVIALSRLTTFHGLFFAFGYVTKLAYLDKAAMPRLHMLRNAGRILLAYYIVGLAYVQLVLRAKDPSAFVAVLLFRRFAGYSEFLITYGLVLLLLIFLPGLFRVLLRRRVLFWLVVAGLAAFALLDVTRVSNPLLVLWIGGPFASFPVIQYLPLFLLGMYVAHYGSPATRLTWLAALAGVAVYAHALVNGAPPQRFPPTLPWIVGGFGFMAILYQGMPLLARLPRLASFFIETGRSTLYWFVLSSLLIFAVESSNPSLVFPDGLAWIPWLAILAVIAFLKTLIR